MLFGLRSGAARLTLERVLNLLERYAHGKQRSTAGQFARALAKAGGMKPMTVSKAQTDALQRETVLRLVTSDGREFPVYRGKVTHQAVASSLDLPYSPLSDVLGA